jgi:CRISPR/Cas system-associated protein Csm6
MSEAAIKQYIKTAPFKEILGLEKLIMARQRAEQEKTEIDAAIKRGLADVKAGRVFTAEEVKEHLREYVAELEKNKCKTPA